jgi:hypothetical protein
MRNTYVLVSSVVKIIYVKLITVASGKLPVNP